MPTFDLIKVAGSTPPSFSLIGVHGTGLISTSNFFDLIKVAGSGTLAASEAHLDLIQVLGSGALAMSVEPIGGRAGVEPLSIMTLTAQVIGTVPDSYTWRVISGTPITLNQTGATVTFVAPGSKGGTQTLLGVTATKGAQTSEEREVSITTKPVAAIGRVGTDPTWRAAGLSRGDAARDKLRQAWALAPNVPVNNVFTGSSTTLGTGASITSNRYVNKTVASLQTTHSPDRSGSSVQANTSATFTTITAAGINGYNAGEGGTTAANFLTADERTRIAALNPAMIGIMIGSNDYSFNVAPATYQANLQTVLNDFRAKSPNSIFVLMHSFMRLDVTNRAYAWTAYRDVMKNLADMSPDDTLFFDLSIGWNNAWIGPDNIHPNDAGHNAIATSLIAALDMSV